MKALAQALVAAQAEMPAVEPDQVNPHFKSKFVSLDHLIAKTRPVLNRHGLAIVQLPATSELGAPVLRTILLHGPSGEQISTETPLLLARQDMQAFGGAITYARRYAWAAALGIVSDEDQDGNQASVAGEPADAVTAAATEIDMSDPNLPFGDYPAEQLLPPAAKPVTKPQLKKIMALFSERGFTSSDERHAFTSAALNRSIASSVDMTVTEATKLIGILESRASE